jgi:hypothetical protein
MCQKPLWPRIRGITPAAAGGNLVSVCLPPAIHSWWVDAHRAHQPVALPALFLWITVWKSELETPGSPEQCSTLTES